MLPYPRLAAVLIIGLQFSVTCGQEAEKPAEADRFAHLARMKELASSVHIFVARADSRLESELVPEPVLRYSDNTRRTLESSLWIWGKAGRPTAILAIEFHPNQRPGPRWLYEIASLATERIAAERGDDLKWTAKEPGLQLQPIPAAAPPASQPVRRLAQMKALRERFTANERAPIEGRIELRPLTSPLHRYSDSAGGIVDGAIFSFANGTNPEVLLVIEAQESDGKSGWAYGLVQLTGETVKAQLDGKDVWERETANPPAVRDSYVNGWLPSEPTK